MNQTIYGDETREKSTEILLTDVPIEVTTLLVEYLEGRELVGFGSHQVALVENETLVLDDLPFEDVGTVTTLEIMPDPLVTPAGTNLQLQAFTSSRDGFPVDLTSSVDWASSEPSIATVDDTGLLKGITVGTSTVSATLPGSEVSAQKNLLVTNASIQSLSLRPTDITIEPGEEYLVVAEGEFSDGSIRNANSLVEWASSNSASLSINSFGLLTGLVNGISTITADFGNGSESVTVTVGTVPLLFVAGGQERSWSRFRLNSPIDGDVAPDNKVVGATLFSPEGLFYDPDHDELWVGSQTNNEVFVYNSRSDGTVEPLREFTVGPNLNTAGIFYDRSRDLLYVTSSTSGPNDAINIYENPREIKSGTPTPDRRITFTGDVVPFGLFLDEVSDRLYVGLVSEVYVIDGASTADGEISTLSPRVIAVDIERGRGITVDVSRDVLYVARDGFAGGPGRVSVFTNASTANSPSGASAILQGANTSIEGDTDGVAIDPQTDELYVGTRGAGVNRVVVFGQASQLSGQLDIAPSRVLSGSNFGVDGPGGLFFFRP